MREYDIYIKSMKDGKATIWLMMELYGLKLADATEAVKEDIAGAGVPENYVEEIVRKMSAIGTITYVVESDESKKANAPAYTRKCNPPSIIALIISCINMVVAILGIFAGKSSYGAMGFCLTMIVAIIIFSIIGFAKVKQGRGRKVYPLVALLLGIASCIISVIGPIMAG